MDIFAEPSKNSAPSSSMGKKKFIEGTDNPNLLFQQIIFTMIKKNPKCPSGVSVSQKPGEIPDVLTQCVEQRIPFFFVWNLPIQ